MIFLLDSEEVENKNTHDTSPLFLPIEQDRSEGRRIIHGDSRVSMLRFSVDQLECVHIIHELNYVWSRHYMNS